jgi:protein TonB
MSGTTPFAESGTAVMAQLDADIHVERSQVQTYMEVPTVLQRPQAIERPIITRRTMPDYGWLARALRERLEQVTSYPPAAKMNRWEGQVIVQVSVQADGHLVNPSIEQSSGYAMLDEAAIEALRQASPLALRHRLDRPQVDVSVPLTYQLE